MTKKVILILTVFALLMFTSSLSLATNVLQDAGNGIRNIVGGAENVVEDAVGGTANAVRDGFNNGGNMVQNATENMRSRATSTNENNKTMPATRNGNGYTATRTSDTATFAGMNATAWTWFIMGIVTIAIVALIWYYGNQRDTNVNRHHE